LSTRLDGKVAIVTGASSGLGAHFAAVLAQAGASVALVARRWDPLAQLSRRIVERGGAAHAWALDVSDPSRARAVIDDMRTALGRIDVLVNNAGIYESSSLIEAEESSIDRIMGVNVKGALFMAQGAARHMIADGIGGRIVNIASVAALRPIAKSGVYAMSKAALVQMTRSLAHELAPNNINVNAICPGYVETEANTRFWASESGRKRLTSLPRQRIAKPSDLDGALLLLSSEQSAMMSGAIVSVDDGLSL
jgi:NAD(P)-dependent dehydrogenase (short-subunit alcohol dehydrogenase family)